MVMKRKISAYKQKLKRVELVGSDGVNKQDTRRRAAKTPKAVTRDVQKRMSEYRTGRVSNEADHHSKAGKAGYKK